MVKKIIFSLIIFSIYTLQFSQVADVKYSKAKIYYNNASDLELLLQNGIDVEHGKNKLNTYVESIFSATEIKNAQDLGFKVEIIIDDWKNYYHKNIKKAPYERNPAPCNEEGSDYETPQNFNLGSMGGFLNYTEFLNELDEMRTLYPNLISVKSPISTFTTAQNRPIYWVKISDNPNVEEVEQEILYTAIHHAREPGSLQQLVFFMWYLLENYNTNTEIQTLVNNSQIFFVPVINPDGYVYNQTTDPTGGGMWRKNRRNNGGGTYGVDNNRNYSYHWGETGTSTNPSVDTYCGPSAFSEPENQAIKWLVESRNFIVALNAHTYGNLLLFPYGWQTNTYTPDHDDFLQITDVMVAENGYTNQISSALYAASGDSDDWMYADTVNHDKIFAMTPEIGDEFWISENAIIPLCKNMVHLNLTGLRLIHNVPVFSDLSPSNTSNLSNTLSYTVKNLSIMDNPANFTLSIVPISSNILSVGNPITHNNVGKLQSVSSSINYQLKSDIQSGETIRFKVVIHNGMFPTEVLINKTYGSYTSLLSDAGNAIAPNWNSSTWSTSSTVYFSPSKSITDSPNGNYTNNANKTIVSTNQFNLSNVIDAKCSFYAKWDLENNYDYVQFEVSTNGGTTWQPQCGKFTNAGVADQNVEGEPLFDGKESNWVQEEISLNQYIGNSIKVRFQLVSDGGVSGDGFYFDDFNIKVLPVSTASLDENTIGNWSVIPNPATDFIQIVSNNNFHSFNIELFNLTGQLIYQFEQSKDNQLIDISYLSQGVYLIKMSNLTSSKTIRLIKE